MTANTIDSFEKPIQPRSSQERIFDNGFKIAAKTLAIAICLLIIWIILQVLIQAFPAIGKFGLGFLFSSQWDPIRDNFGLWPSIFGTLVSSALALLIAVPIGIGVAIFLSEDYIPSGIQRVFVFLVELLAAIPSVVYGLWGLFVLVPFLRPVGVTRASMLPAVIILSIMVLPMISAISRDALSNVSKDMRQAAIGLGATRWETILQIVIPAASSGIIGGVMLALGRALGETMAIVMLIGNSNQVSFSLLQPATTISALIANQFAEAQGLQVSALMYAAFVLSVITLIVNILAQVVVKQLQKI
ncbi:MAG: phosphate ABC transporter permease subunit PstC [Gloeocapsa sp. DLM2.Bin57]|nr:MAG: phosphate ABC transporter permease subunit PstC [Gloeocapsa sp. DLM2.Bin57]